MGLELRVPRDMQPGLFQGLGTLSVSLSYPSMCSVSFLAQGHQINYNHVSFENRPWQEGVGEGTPGNASLGVCECRKFNFSRWGLKKVKKETPTPLVKSPKTALRSIWVVLNTPLGVLLGGTRKIWA